MNDTDKLYSAIRKYIENRGGKVIVIGGVEIAQYPGDRDFTYYIAVKITGRKPEKNLLVVSPNSQKG